jgi:hypothetical protein
MMRVSSAALLITVIVGCDDGLPDDASMFATRAAAIACEAVFRCCSPDLAMQFGSGYFESSDEPTCRTGLSKQLKEELRAYLQSPTVRFDRAAAQRCLDAAQATVKSCDAIYGIRFQVASNAAYSCPGILNLTLREGDPCAGNENGCGDCTACYYENGHSVCGRVGPSPGPSTLECVPSCCPNQTTLVDPAAQATVRMVLCTPTTPVFDLNPKLGPACDPSMGPRPAVCGSHYCTADGICAACTTDSQCGSGFMCGGRIAGTGVTEYISDGNCYEGMTCMTSADCTVGPVHNCNLATHQCEF